MLERAGFRMIRFSDVHEPMYFGRDGADALEHVCGFQHTRDMLARLSPADAARALERLRDTLAAHQVGDQGVLFDSRAWLVTARRR